jgi:hypothetical protein
MSQWNEAGEAAMISLNKGGSSFLGWIGAVLALLWAADTRAQACRESECDFQSASTVLRDNVWRADCGEGLTARLDPRFYGGTLRPPVSFVRGVCLFERIARGLVPLDAPDPRGMRPVVRAIAELQSAQSSAISFSQRQVAALFEGLLHCKQLDQLAALDAAPGTPSWEQRCMHRSMAKANFARVDLVALELRYADAADQGRVGQSIDGMLACQSAHLHSAAAARCGTSTTATTSELQRVADVAAGAILPRYFGQVPGATEGPVAVPPVTALLARKIGEATAASQGSREAFAALRTERDAVQGQHDTLETKLCEGDAQRCLPGAVAALFSTYETAVVRVSEYLAFVRQALAGLFLDGGKEDLNKVVAENLRAATDSVKLLEPKQAPLQQLRDDLTRLGADARGDATLRRACKLLFCDIWGGPRLRVDNACRAVDPASPTRAPLAATNPLCKADPAAQLVLGPGSASSASICREVGVEPGPTACN